MAPNPFAAAVDAGSISGPPAARDYLSDRIFRILAYGGAGAIVVLVAYIVWEIGGQAAPAIAKYGLGFLTSTTWDVGNEKFGILPQIWGTLYSSLLALLIGGFFGVFVAIFLTQGFLPPKLAVVFRTIVELLAAIPSVVYGLWGIYVVIPALRPIADWLHQTLGFIPFFSTSLSGPGLMPAALVLAIMILPTVAAISQDALHLVPIQGEGGGLRHGHDPLGGHPQGVPADGLAGDFRLDGARLRPRPWRDDGPGDADRQRQPDHPVAVLAGQHAGVAAGVELPRSRRDRDPGADVRRHRPSRDHLDRQRGRPVRHDHRRQETVRRSCISTNIDAQRVDSGRSFVPDLRRTLSNRRALRSAGLSVMTWVVALIAAVPLFSVLYMLIVEGGARFSLDLFTELPPAGFEMGGGFGNAIVGTLVMVGIASAISVPVGILGAAYLSELGPEHKLAAVSRFLAKVLTGFPSILAGVFAYAAVVVLMGTYSALAGGIALSVLMLPTVILTAEESMKMVPPRMKDAAYGMGCTRSQVIWKVVLPTGLPGILTGVMLAIAGAAGKSAPLLFTALFSNYWLHSVHEPTASLSILIYNFSGMPFENQIELAWAASLVLVLIVLVFNILSRLIGRPKV